MLELYLGDGVYATADGGYIKLDLRGQDNHTQMFLGRVELQGLVQFARKNGMDIK